MEASSREAAGVVELGRWGDRARLERRRRHDDLEDRARWIETLGGPVEQRRARVRVEVRPYGVDLVGIVARIRDHGQHRPGARVEGHHRSFAVPESLGRGPLHGHVDRQPEIGAPVRLAQELVPVAGDAEDARLARQLLVVDPLDPGPAVPQAVVAQPGGGETALRVLTQEVLALLGVDGQAQRRRPRG